MAGTMSGETPELTFVYTTADSQIHQPKPATLVIKYLEGYQKPRCDVQGLHTKTGEEAKLTAPNLLGCY